MKKPTETYDLQLSKRSKYLHLNVTGKRNLKTLKTLVEDIIEVSGKYKYSKILIDLRYFGEPIDMLNSWELVASKMVNGVKGIFVNIAVIEKEGSIRIARFYERAVRNLGHNLYVFSDEQKAIDWLEGKS